MPFQCINRDRVMPPVDMHPFGTAAYMSIEPRYRMHRQSDVAERCYHLCNGAFNYFAHPGVDVPRANVLSGKTVYPYLKLSDDLAVNDAMLNEGGDSTYDPVALDDIVLPLLPPLDPPRKNVFTDSVPVTLRPAEAPSITRHPIVPPPTRAQVGPVSRLVGSGRQAAAAAASPARPRPSSGASTPGDRSVAPVVPAPNTAGPASGTSPTHAASGASATPTRIADMSQDYVPHPGVLRGQDYGITFLRSSKAGQRNEDKYAKSTARRLRLVDILLLAAPQRTGDTTFNIVMFVLLMPTCSSERTLCWSFVPCPTIRSQMFFECLALTVFLSTRRLLIRRSPGEISHLGHTLPHRLCTTFPTLRLSSSLQS